MENRKSNKIINKICPESDRKKGLCSCEVEGRVGQTNLIPKESTDFVCRRKLV